MTRITSLIDFVDPLNSAAPRLRHAFGQPRAVLAAHTLAEVRPLLDAVQAAAQQGQWCVGHVAYEAAPAFDAALAVHLANGPLAWFAVYDQALPWPADDEGAQDDAKVQWQSSCSREAFGASVAQIQQAIADGELYQVNLTAPLLGEWLGAPPAGAARALFAALQRAQPSGYAAFIDTGDEQVLSVSPELFFDWQDAGESEGEDEGGHILTRPMKGTAARGDTPEQDAAQAAALRASPKERAENVMIVDLLRNDLSRIAQPFSVRVPDLFHTQALPTVWQMTSDVQATTRVGTTLAEVFGALFPCGSVTGAPKVRAMQMIRRLEPEPRGVYCGAVGVVRPKEPGKAGQPGQGIRATFNVPIRTVTLKNGGLRCGIGSGITSGALPDAEWQEWQDKRKFLERASAPFDLLETLALEGGQLRHAADHLQRLANAAAHFAYPWDGAKAECCLRELAQAHRQGLWRVRLLQGARGNVHAEAFAMQASTGPVRLQLADRPLVEAHGEFVRFKTTRRAHYDAFTPTAPGVFDCVLFNAQGEITECTRGNVAMLLDGQWVTPSLACGLLPGVGRALALREGRLLEAVVRVEDVPRVQGWAFLNSLRGWLAAEMV
ncbi:MAG: chorismate-binding protein [Polaromonas sp.]